MLGSSRDLSSGKIATPMETVPPFAALFVDDEPAVLKLLARMLADLRGSWRMEFAESALEGLALMEKSSFDAVVSDLRMPGMNGIDFLKEVRERYPLAARIVYSSYIDQHAAIHYVGLVHQFLPKPCPPEWIRGAIQRIALIRKLLPAQTMREHIARMEQIVSMPTLYLQLVRQIQSVETPIEDIASTISQDLGMTSQVLRIVNSAFFGLPQPTQDVAQAISFLGLDTLKHLVLALGIFAQFEQHTLGGLNLPTLWQHSVRTAQAARCIARHESAPREMVEDATAAGLLHDLGKLVLATQYPDQYVEVTEKALENNVESIVEERKLFGFDHAEVAGYLLGLWGLPIPVVQAVAFHHAPAKSGTSEFTALTAVHAANVLVQPQHQPTGGLPPPDLDLAYLAKTGRTQAADRWREALEATPSA